jgi:dienelactone hydrolase
MRWRSAVTVLALLVTAAACAVVPSYPRTDSVFRGFPVVSSIPTHPRGVVYLFHGTAGGVGFADRLETVDMLNHLTTAGYGVVVTESTDRASKQWDSGSLSLSTNPDLARLAALHASLVAGGRITDATPILAIGMSQGAGFASVFARAFHDAGYPVRAIAPSHGQIPAVVRAAGGPGVPIFTALGANDTTVPNDRVVRQIADLQAQGLAAEVTIEPEVPLGAGRFLRVPGVDGPTADAIFAALVRAGLWDAQGRRRVGIDQVEASLPGVALPASLGGVQRQAVHDEIDVVLAVHQYSATYADRTVAFFDAHR